MYLLVIQPYPSAPASVRARGRSDLHIASVAPPPGVRVEICGNLGDSGMASTTSLAMNFFGVNWPKNSADDVTIGGWDSIPVLGKRPPLQAAYASHQYCSCGCVRVLIFVGNS